MVRHSRSLYDRNYTCSTGGNVSHRYGDGFLISATGTSFGRLRPDTFATCDLNGNPAGEGPKPSKEAPFHAAIYRRRPEARAILHLHSTLAIAYSTLVEPTDTGNVLPVITSYSLPGAGRLPLLEYLKPGSAALAERIEAVCAGVNGMLLQNHGVITWAPSLDQAVDIAEEIEQNIRLWFITGGQARVLTDAEMAEHTPLYGAWIEPGGQRPRLRPGVNPAALKGEL